MKKFLPLLLLLITYSFSFAQLKSWRNGEMEARIQIHKPADAKLLSSLKINCDIDGNTALAYLVPSELEALKNAGFSYVITKPDLNAWSASFGPALVPPGYYSWQQIKIIADSLATHFPSICKKIVYGYNAQMQELAALKISDNVNVDENEPEIMFDGGIHGDEVGGSQNVIQFARDLCLAYGVDPDITGLIDTREIFLYYCVNPWGRDAMSRYNSANVDINRDNGYMWAGEGGSPGPFSQPETRALRKCQYDNQFVSYTNYHSGTETISYPWSYRYSPCPDQSSIDHLASIYSAASGYASLPYGQGSMIMYLIGGSTKDYNYGTLGSAAWSIEISSDKQPTDVQHFYYINKPAMLELIRNVGYGIQGTVTDAVTGKPVRATIFVGNNYPVYSDPVVGDFHKYLIPGLYSLKVIANGYEPVTINAVSVSDQQATTVDVQLTPLSCQYIYRVITCNIPNFNAQNPGDESYTAGCLGPPDNVNYSLGKGGYIIFDMQDTVYDYPDEPDIKVFEGDNGPEGFTLYSGETMDGPWTNLGYEMGTMEIDLGTYGVHKARYFMIMDDNSGVANTGDAGYDLDAVASLHPAVPDTVGHLSGRVYDVYTLLPLPGVEVRSGDSVMITDSSGYYSLQLSRGTREICSSLEGYRTECDTLALLPATAYVNDFYLFSTVGKPELTTAGISLKAMPNPFRDQLGLSIESARPSKGKLDLFDLSGSLIFTKSNVQIRQGIQAIDLNTEFPSLKSLSAGVYILRLSTPSGDFHTRLVKAL